MSRWQRRRQRRRRQRRQSKAATQPTKQLKHQQQCSAQAKEFQPAHAILHCSDCFAAPAARFCRASAAIRLGQVGLRRPKRCATPHRPLFNCHYCSVSIECIVPIGSDVCIVTTDREQKCRAGSPRAPNKSQVPRRITLSTDHMQSVSLVHFGLLTKSRVL